MSLFELLSRKGAILQNGVNSAPPPQGHAGFPPNYGAPQNVNQYAQGQYPAGNMPGNMPGGMGENAHTGSAQPMQQPAWAQSQQPSPQPQAPVSLLHGIPEQWSREIQKIAHFLSSGLDVNDKLCLAFSGLERGSGVTTVSYLVAHYLADESHGRRVLFIDFTRDNQQNGWQNGGHTNGLIVGQPIGETLPVYNAHSLYRIQIMANSSQSASSASRWFREFMDTARQTFDVIIADTPPFSIEPEGFSLAKSTDGVVLVVNSGDTRYPAFNTLVDNLNHLSIPTVGTVMNRRVYPIPKWLLSFI